MIVYGLKAIFPEQKGNIREIRPVWALEELCEKYEIIFLNPKLKENDTEEFLRISPFGTVPAIRDGDFSLFESAAICTYIGDKHGKLVPPMQTRERALYDQWISAILSNIEPHTVRIIACDYFLERGEKTSHLREMAERMLATF
jgi:glutathione S-transferase